MVSFPEREAAAETAASRFHLLVGRRAAALLPAFAATGAALGRPALRAAGAAIPLLRLARCRLAGAMAGMIGLIGLIGMVGVPGMIGMSGMAGVTAMAGRMSRGCLRSRRGLRSREGRRREDDHFLAPSDFEKRIRDRQENRGGGGSASGRRPVRLERSGASGRGSASGAGATRGAGAEAMAAQATMQSTAIRSWSFCGPFW
jgi:hypothetical protein